MAQDNSKAQPAGRLEEAKRLLQLRGLRPIDYKHLDYEGILRLAGMRP